MKDLKSGYTFLLILLMIALSGTFAVAEYHYVEDCTVCHYSGEQEDSEGCNNCPNIKHVRCDIDTPNSGPRAVIFPPYVRGEEPYDGVCEVCHTLTTYHRNNASGDPHPEYQPGLGGPGTDCMLCHKHAPYEFGHEATVGSGCEPCHGQDGGPGTAFSHATHTEGDVPRGPSTAMACGDCHDTNNYPLFGDDDNEETLADTTACDNCHSASGVAMAKANWDDGVYKSDGTALQSGKEDWCATCHDNDPATVSGQTAKNVSGDDSIYGYFISGHGKYNVSCTDCHDPRLTHFDDYARTYHAGEEETGPRGYTQGYRLHLVDGQPPLDIPRTDAYDISQFALCYLCHSETRILNSGFNNFVDLFEFGSPIGENPLNYHGEGGTSAHLLLDHSWDSDRDGDYGSDSRFSCPTCHNPHGKNYKGRATFSMTRKDLGIVHQRQVMYSFGYYDNTGWHFPGGDLFCFDACHPGASEEYYFQLGTTPPEEPAFWTKLDSEPSDVTDPTYGIGGTLLGGSFETYYRYSDKLETGLAVEMQGTDGGGEPLEGCKFPTSNLNNDDEIDGETIDFWYVPKFDLSGHTGEEYLFHSFVNENNWISIRVISAKLSFKIKSDGSAHALKTTSLDWQPDAAHNIVCTWGPAQGMHIYLDKLEPEYNINTGLTYTGGIGQLPLNFYIGNSADGLYPAHGIIDDFKIYGYQYQKFENGPAFFSKLGALTEVENPVIGNGGTVNGAVDFTSADEQHLGSAHFTNTYNGVIEFPTSNLNSSEDTIDFWYHPAFDPRYNTGATKHLFYCEKDADNFALIKIDENELKFKIKKDGTGHAVQTTDLDSEYRGPYTWYHIVCTWGPDDGRPKPGMRIYINDQEAEYSWSDGNNYYDGLPLPSASGYFQIGNTSADADNYCDGYIDELRIYGYQAGAQ